GRSPSRRRYWTPTSRRSGRWCCAAIVPPSPPAWPGATSPAWTTSKPSWRAAPRWRSNASHWRWRPASAISPPATAGCAPPAVRRLIVFALGKLGGGELNFSSDIDLVYGYDSDDLAEASDGPRPLAAEPYFSRLGQQLARLLGEHTADGFCHRVDLRLRPYGSTGRSAWSLAAMELYFQQEGRDWERYAWQKARPVAGDVAGGEAFLEILRPFVYRRYLDFGALEGLRDMKAAVSAEVARRELADDIKRGPGGIREIEFL